MSAPTLEGRIEHAKFAIFLHRRGWGYGRIARELRYPKSTIQDWITGRRLGEHTEEDRAT